VRRKAFGRSANMMPTARRRRRIAAFGVVLVLFQALLFGWHTHPIAFTSHQATAVTSAQSGAPNPAGIDEDDCDICAALHHHSAAPLAVGALPSPPVSAERVHSFTLALFERTLARAFEARAPPRA
jgi:Protein of unknown function (DUF2946)